MTERKIVIKNCEKCPHIDDDNQYVPPFCVKMNKNLPSTTGKITPLFTTYKIYKPTYEIPDWCPLEENDK